MKVFSINPKSGEYFEDKSEYINIDDKLYQGEYNYTPIYPLYTFQTSGRFNYESQNPEIEFLTMLPIRRLSMRYLVETRYRYIIDNYDIDSIEKIIKIFKRECERNINIINVNKLKK